MRDPDEDLAKLAADAIDLITLHDGRLLSTHGPLSCKWDEHCCIHKPSDHPLKDAPLNWRESGPFDWKPSHMERMCPHGIGHPDPDSLRFIESKMGTDVAETVSTHGCDGCCSGARIDG